MRPSSLLSLLAALAVTPSALGAEQPSAAGGEADPTAERDAEATTEEADRAHEGAGGESREAGVPSQSADEASDEGREAGAPSQSADEAGGEAEASSIEADAPTEGAGETGGEDVTPEGEAGAASESGEDSAADDRDLEPEDGLPKPDPEDLRAGHWLLSVGGGVWVPSTPFTPRIDELGELDAGGSVHLQVGVGLNRYVVLALDGGYARLVGADEACEGCAADSFDAGASMALFLSQGFAFEPWASYGIGYRHTALSLDRSGDRTLRALEVARLALGGTYFPIPSLGLGPYVEADVGFRDFEAPTFYAAFGSGLRVTFDPVRIGTEVRPQIGAR